MDKKRVLISVISKQNGNEDDRIEVVTPGDFYKKDDSYYAVYKETQITGMDDTTTTFKISPEKFSLIRIGSTSTKMNFVSRGEDIVLYNTPYGTMELKIETKDLSINVGDAGGDITIKYNMSVAGQKPQNTSLKINIKAQDA